ncbi:unnamed protein product [Caenorhabditis nigoni]
MRIVRREEDKNDYFQLNVSGKTIAFRFQRVDQNIRLPAIENSYYLYPVASYQVSEKESVTKSIHNYFLDFFGDSMKYQWQADGLHNPDFLVPLLPKLQNVSYCITMRLGWDVANMPKLESIFSQSPILKSIKMVNSTQMEQINPESKFYQAESIEFRHHYPASPVILRHFKGRQLFLTSVGTTEDLIEFVNRWKSGEAFQKMEFLEFKVYRNDLLHDRIFNEIGAKYIDELKQPPAHTLPKVYHWYYEPPNTKPIISHTYVVRETDNRVASILIQERTFYFGVWNKTEEKFLKMVK